MSEDRRVPEFDANIRNRVSQEESLSRFYDQFRSKDRVLITIDPDPDAIGSALAVKRLLRHRVRSTTVGIIRPIRRMNNLTMVKLLRIPLVQLNKDHRLEHSEHYDRFVLVDGQPCHNPFFENLDYSAVIDHHPFGIPFESPFADIRGDYGSTSTILTEYLHAASIKPSRSLATTLLYGIKTDTRNFERHTILNDIDAFRSLYPLADHNVLMKIEIADLSLRDLRFFHKAFERKHVVRDRIFAHLDEVSGGDILVEIAEFMLKINGISWSVISGIINGNLIIVVRNDGRGKDAGKLMRRAFGNIGCAGGHHCMARAEIPLENLSQAIGKIGSTDIERFIRNQLSPFP